MQNYKCSYDYTNNINNHSNTNNMGDVVLQALGWFCFLFL